MFLRLCHFKTFRVGVSTKPKCERIACYEASSFINITVKSSIQKTVTSSSPTMVKSLLFYMTSYNYIAIQMTKWSLTPFLLPPQLHFNKDMHGIIKIKQMLTERNIRSVLSKFIAPSNITFNILINDQCSTLLVTNPCFARNV